MKGIEPPREELSAEGMRFGIVAARFNDSIVERLLRGALKILERYGASVSMIERVQVPGAFELPLAVKKLAETKRFDAIIALGCVIRGETPHFDYVAGECARGLAALALEYGIPVTFGVLTTNTFEQAAARADLEGCNKGSDAALAAIEMVSLMRNIKGQ